jgi:hypothetical protein
MSKEEPAWRREVFRELYGRVTHPEIIPLLVNLVEPHILAAEQRGFQAGVNKTGDSVGKLRAKLAAVREELDSPLLHGQDPDRQGERWLAQRVRNIINAPDKS